jgi:hypothetical protein
MPHSQNVLCVALITLQIGSFAGCTRGHIDAAQVVETAFEGFVYVGSFPGVEYSPPSHSHEAARTPDRYEVGRLYVFHYAGALDDALFAMTELPRRLRLGGATVVEAPSSKSELPSVDPGDRVWRVVFIYDGLRGTIYNTLDRELYQRGGLKPGGNVNSFVLRFDPA